MHKALYWDDITVPINRIKLDNKKTNNFFQLLTEPKRAQRITERVSNILDTHYAKANLADIVEHHC